jgi:hypothetical protein
MHFYSEAPFPKGGPTVCLDADKLKSSAPPAEIPMYQLVIKKNVGTLSVVTQTAAEITRICREHLILHL